MHNAGAKPASSLADTLHRASACHFYTMGDEERQHPQERKDWAIVNRLVTSWNRVVIPHRECEDVGQLGEAVQHEGDDSECHIGAHDAEGRDADKVAEELLLFH